MPVFNNPTHDKVLIPSDWTFQVDVEKNIVNVSNGKEMYLIGNAITYIVES